MDFFLFLAKRQNKKGQVIGVHNQDVCRHTGMCKQSFYSALRSLEEKNVISVYKASEIDYNVTILNNDFSGKDDLKPGCEGYIDLHREIFHRKQFKRLKAKEKWLLFYFLHCTHENSRSYRIGTQNFYNKFTELLGVTRRIIRMYLHSLRYFFSIGIKNGLYYITYKRSVFDQKQNVGMEKQEHEYFVSAICRRYKVKSITHKTIEDVAEMIKQYRQVADQLEYDIFERLHQIIRQVALEKEKPKERTVNAKYVHKLLRKSLYLG